MASALPASGALGMPSAMGVATCSSEVTIWRAPLVPFALAVTAGIVADRYAGIPVPICLLIVVLSMVVWAVFFFGGKPELAVVYLGISAAACGAGYHHGYRNVYAADDVGDFVTADTQIVH